MRQQEGSDERDGYGGKGREWRHKVGSGGSNIFKTCFEISKHVLKNEPGQERKRTDMAGARRSVGRDSFVGERAREGERAGSVERDSHVGERVRRGGGRGLWRERVRRGERGGVCGER